MKIVIVKDSKNESLVPLTLHDEDTVFRLIDDWSTASGHDGADYIFKTSSGEMLRGDMFISELPVPVTGYSSVEVIAEKTVCLFVAIYGPGSLSGRLLEFQLTLSLTMAPLSEVVCQELHIPHQELEFRPKADPLSTVPPAPFDSEASLLEQSLKENDVIECDFYFDIVVMKELADSSSSTCISSPSVSDSGISASSGSAQRRRLNCRCDVRVVELLDSSIPLDQQRLSFKDRVLDNSAVLVKALEEQLYNILAKSGSRTVTLQLERRLNVRLFHEAAGKAPTLATAWSGRTISDWLKEVAPSSAHLPVWHRDTELLTLDATLGSVHKAAWQRSLDPLLLHLDKGLDLSVTDSRGRRHPILVRRHTTVAQLRQRVAALEQDADFSMHLGDVTLSSGDCSLASCGAADGSVLVLRVKAEEVLVMCEGREVLVTGVHKAATFHDLLRRAEAALGTRLPPDCAVECCCGRRIDDKDSEAAAMPERCCSVTPRRLLLFRPVWVSVRTGDGRPISRLRIRSCQTAWDVLVAAMKRESEEAFGRRLCVEGRVLDRAETIYGVKGNEEEEVRMTLEEQRCLCVRLDSGSQLLWRVWPSEAAGDVIARLREAGHVTGERVRMTKDSGEVVTTVAGLENGETVCVGEIGEKPVAWKSQESVKEVLTKAPSVSSLLGDKAAPNNSTGEQTTALVISRNSGVPDFELYLAIPLTILKLRTEVAKRFGLVWQDVSLLQHRATSREGRRLVDIGNYHWADSTGRMYPNDEVTKIHKGDLQNPNEFLVIPRNRRWKVFVSKVKK